MDYKTRWDSTQKAVAKRAWESVLVTLNRRRHVLWHVFDRLKQEFPHENSSELEPEIGLVFNTILSVDHMFETWERLKEKSLQMALCELLALEDEDEETAETNDEETNNV